MLNVTSKKILAVTLLSILAPIQAFAMDDNAQSSVIERLKTEFSDSIDSLKSYSIAKKEQATKSAQETLAQVDEQLDEYENMVNDKWDTLSTESKKNYRNTIKALRIKRNQLSENLGTMKNSTKNQWEEAKTNFKNSWDDFKDAWLTTDQAANS